MLFHQLSTSALLRIVEFNDLEQFSAAERFVDSQSIPLRMKAFFAARATLTLPRSTVVLLGSFPRILDAVYDGDDSIVVLAAEPPDRATINGMPIGSNSIGILRGRSTYSALERAPNWYFSMKFDQSVAGRGWPNVMDGLALFEASPLSMSALRSTLTDAFTSASRVPRERPASIVLESMEESLLWALDRVFNGSTAKLVDQRPPGLHLRLVAQIDLRLASDPSAPIYSKALAEELDVSVRSLHSATMSIRGMSLHRYLKLKRLWLVRRRLLSAAPGARIKSFALAHGFWHLGNFSGDYQKLFGELPSQTLARAGGSHPNCE